ncbi:hypothetical protein [Dyadobacter sp. CY356]|nr:hypothetical protein [Dyadobacter sp. CY356]
MDNYLAFLLKDCESDSEKLSAFNILLEKGTKVFRNVEEFN